MVSYLFMIAVCAMCVSRWLVGILVCSDLVHFLIVFSRLFFSFKLIGFLNFRGSCLERFVFLLVFDQRTVNLSVDDHINDDVKQLVAGNAQASNDPHEPDELFTPVQNCDSADDGPQYQRDSHSDQALGSA